MLFKQIFHIASVNPRTSEPTQQDASPTSTAKLARLTCLSGITTSYVCNDKPSRIFPSARTGTDKVKSFHGL